MLARTEEEEEEEEEEESTELQLSKPAPRSHLEDMFARKPNENVPSQYILNTSLFPKVRTGKRVRERKAAFVQYLAQQMEENPRQVLDPLRVNIRVDELVCGCACVHACAYHMRACVYACACSCMYTLSLIHI